MKAAILCNGINWTINKNTIYIYVYIYIYSKAIVINYMPTLNQRSY